MCARQREPVAWVDRVEVVTEGAGCVSGVHDHHVVQRPAPLVGACGRLPCPTGVLEQQNNTVQSGSLGEMDIGFLKLTYRQPACPTI